MSNTVERRLLRHSGEDGLSRDVAARMGPWKPGRPASGWQWVRFVGNFANLSTPLGLAVAGMGGATIKRGPRGLFLAEGYRLGFPIAGAFTDRQCRSRPAAHGKRCQPQSALLIKHEEAHTWQYLYCLGLPYYIPYVIFMGWSVIRTGDRAARNFFERQAGLSLGRLHRLSGEADRGRNPRPYWDG